ncbi:MAG: DMT family transporter [Eubacteriales bacterium]|nr:DMT family transporter [Eubacteriales bacterium]
MKKDEKLGYVLAMLGGVCWACSGACGQYLFQHRLMHSNWLVAVRLLIAGLLLSCYSMYRWRDKVEALFRSKRSIGSLLVLSVFGLALCQYAYFRSIELSNAATATAVQYVGLVMVLIWLAIGEKRLPRRGEIAALVCALGGAFVLTTHGDPSHLVLSTPALLWCIASAAAFAVYSVQPRGLIDRFGTLPVTGFGMLIGGLVLCARVKPWHVVGTWDGVTVGGMSFIIVFGTLCAFCCYLEGVRRIGAARGSILAAVEPVVSALLSVFWLGVPLGGIDLAGIALIVAAIVLSAESGQGQPKKIAETVASRAKKD